MKYSIEQPQPFDPNCTRYYPIRKFPSYQHIPGVTPHPFNDKTGHSYGLHVEVDAQVPPPEAWRENSTYLYGIDLYNFSYWWEAGEVWEGLWRKTEGSYHLFLQGLIQISFALLKYHMRKLQGVRKLSKSGREKLHQVLRNLNTPTGMYMGVNLITFLNCLDTFFSPFFYHTESHYHTYSQQTQKPLIHLHF